MRALIACGLAALVGCSELLGTNDFTDNNPTPPVDLDGAPGAAGGAGGEGPGDAGAAAPTPWALGFGSRQSDFVSTVALDDDVVVLAGVIGDRVDFGGGLLGDGDTPHLFITRLASDGAHVSSVASGGNAVVHLGGLGIDSGDVVLAGDFHSGQLAIVEGRTPLTAAPRDSDMFVARVTPGGDLAWSFGFPAADNQQIFGVAVDAMGGTIVVGSLRGTLDLGTEVVTSAGSEDALVARFAEDGQCDWAVAFGDNEGQRATAVAVAPDGTIWIAGTFGGVIDLADSHVGIGNSDVFLAQLAPNGTPITSARFGEGGPHQVGSLAAGEDRVVMVGQFIGTTSLGGDPLRSSLSSVAQEDIFIASYDGDGKHAWSRSLGGSGPERAFAAGIDASGSTFVAGSFGSTLEVKGEVFASAGGQDALVLSLRPDGEVDWFVGFGRNDDDETLGLAVDAEGAIIVGGRFQDAFTLGDGIVTAEGSEDVFVAKIVP